MFQTSKLKNGLRLLTIPVASVPSVSVLVLVKVGSRYENGKTNGLAHFTEHMVFQGNDKWKSKFDLSVAVDRVGAEYNGMTAKEYTGYFVKAQKLHLELALDVLSQMLWHSHFLSAQVEREKPVIIEEINYREDSPQIAASDLIMEMVFAGNPLGLSGAGEKESVRKFERPDFLDFHKTHYHSNNTIVVVAGEFIQQEVEEKINQYFSQVESGKQIVPVPFYSSNEVRRTSEASSSSEARSQNDSSRPAASNNKIQVKTKTDT
ncbi:MAG: insulinase family protein, partial [Patescibacteria group bacterium]|nr:insulinase family protein [Patescibacteria group bacterium]